MVCQSQDQILKGRQQAAKPGRAPVFRLEIKSLLLRKPVVFVPIFNSLGETGLAERGLLSKETQSRSVFVLKSSLWVP